MKVTPVVGMMKPDHRPAYVIGMMSGTSLDGVDVVLCDSGRNLALVASHHIAFSPKLRTELSELTYSGSDVVINELSKMLLVERALTKIYVRAVLELLKQTGIAPRDVMVIGCHGQTLRHQILDGELVTLQVGDMHWLSAHTNIPCIGDFRRMDIAMGGQGAPLMPLFHRHCFSHREENRVIVNIGGIANITVLPEQNGQIQGFDSGPGNGLINSWVQAHWSYDYDDGGRLAATGRVNEHLLQACLRDPYFQAPPPKSTGRDYFHLDWLRQRYDVSTLSREDVLATLVAVTVKTISMAILASLPETRRVIVCGGGVKNDFMMAQLQLALPQCKVESSQEHHFHPQWLEAIGFAWLAYQRIQGKKVDTAMVTGAKTSRVKLGALVEV